MRLATYDLLKSHESNHLRYRLNGLYVIRSTDSLVDLI
jgi:hypothetical protein